MFWTVRLSIIRRLFTVYSAMIYVYKPVWHIPLLSVQWINSWWWRDELSETCRVSCQNKFVKLVHLVGFIIKKFVTGKSGLITTYSLVSHLTEHMHQICLKPNSAADDQTGEIKYSLWKNSWPFESQTRRYIITHQRVQCMSSGFRREVAENCALLGFYAAGSGNFLPTFRDNITVPSSGFKDFLNPKGGR